MIVEFVANGSACVAHMCSESQVFSIGDFGMSRTMPTASLDFDFMRRFASPDTNYCNLRNVYCNAVPIAISCAK
jgi:hypothetical protein